MKYWNGFRWCAYSDASDHHAKGRDAVLATMERINVAQRERDFLSAATIPVEQVVEQLEVVERETAIRAVVDDSLAPLVLVRRKT